MEIMRGKQTSLLATAAFMEHLTGYDTLCLDIGTGDGRFVRHLAGLHPNHFVIGLDAARENLVEVSRRVPANTLFVIANAQALPPELDGLADQVTINFPWGSLLEGLLTADAALLAGLGRVMRPHAHLEIRLNGGALAEAGWKLEAGADRVREVLIANGFKLSPPVTLTAADLKTFPTTWAKRLAFGRDPRAVYLRGSRG